MAGTPVNNHHYFHATITRSTVQGPADTPHFYPKVFENEANDLIRVGLLAFLRRITSFCIGGYWPKRRPFRAKVAI